MDGLEHQQEPCVAVVGITFDGLDQMVPHGVSVCAVHAAELGIVGRRQHGVRVRMARIECERLASVAFGFLQHPIHQRILGLLPLLLGGHVQGRIASLWHWHREQGSVERHHLFYRTAIPLEHTFKFIEPRGRRITWLKLQHALDTLNHWIQGTVGVVG